MVYTVTTVYEVSNGTKKIVLKGSSGLVLSPASQLLNQMHQERLDEWGAERCEREEVNKSR